MSAAAVPTSRGVPVALLRAAHIGPALAVTVVAGLLAVAAEHPGGTVVLVTAAVLAGQLTIGWGNDLRDAARDRAVGRTDKPVATGEVPAAAVRTALVVAAVACLALSAALGVRSGLVHLLLLVGGGHVYNLGAKATAWSWAPYAVAFGALPAVATLAGDGTWPPLWAVGTGAALGVGAHFLNTLPDLVDDERTGVRGLPHRLGEARSRLAAAALLGGASVLAVLGPAGDPPVWAWAVLGVVALLVVLAVRGRGRVPFQAAVAIALADVALLVLAGP